MFLFLLAQACTCVYSSLPRCPLRHPPRRQTPDSPLPVPWTLQPWLISSQLIVGVNSCQEFTHTSNFNLDVRERITKSIAKTLVFRGSPLWEKPQEGEGEMHSLFSNDYSRFHRGKNSVCVAKNIKLSFTLFLFFLSIYIVSSIVLYTRGFFLTVRVMRDSITA